MAQFQNRHQDSISPFDWGLCPQVDVRWVPVTEAMEDKRSLRKSVVRVNNVRGAAAEVEFVEQFRYEGGGVAIGEGDKDHSLCETVN